MPCMGGCEIFPIAPDEPLFDIGKEAAGGAGEPISAGVGGTVGGLNGGDLLSPVFCRLFAMFNSTSSVLSRFKLLDDVEGARDGCLEAIACCRLAMSLAKIVGRSAYSWVTRSIDMKSTAAGASIDGSGGFCIKPARSIQIISGKKD